MSKALTVRQKAEIAAEDAQAAIAVKKRKWGEDNCEPGDNSIYLRNALVEYDLPPIDISDPNQVEARFLEYFDHCVKYDRKPNLVGMANWVGVSTKTIQRWKDGVERKETHYDMTRRAYGLLEELYVDYMMNGKVNPGSGCFIGKNHFGYRDTIDIAPAPPAPLGDFVDRAELEQRILQSIPEE